MKNLKVVWPTVLALALAVTITSCRNNKIVEDYEKTKLLHDVPTFEDIFEKADQEIEEIVIPEGFEFAGTEVVEETGFSK